MQYRMKTHQLDMVQVENLLKSEQVGVLATINEDGSPYTTPVHFLYKDGEIYVHGLSKGHKLENLQRNASVCFSVYHMDALLLDESGNPCDTNTKYQSVIAQGKASIVTGFESKIKILSGIVEKYTPHMSDVSLPENMIKGTSVIVIRISEITGEYWK